MRFCNDCKKNKDDNEFSIRDKIRGYRNAYCKTCMTSRAKAWQKGNKESYSEYQREWYKRKKLGG